MKKIIVFSIVIVIISVAAYFYIAPGEASGTETNYTFVSVQRKDISQSVIATGIIKPRIGAEVKVGAQVSGIVKDLFVETGFSVKKNSLLAVIDPDAFKAKRDQAFALKENAETEKKYALIELNRAKALYDKNVITQQQWESASRAYELSCSKLKQTEADYNAALLQLNYTSITSPIDGVVASISTQKGETVAASFAAPTFVTIIDLTRLELWCYVDETDIGRIKKGQKVSFTVDTYPGNPFEGIVETIYPKAEIQNNVVNYITVIKIENPGDKVLRPEMTTTVQIFTDMKKSVPVLDKKFVKTGNGEKYVNVLHDGKVERRYITTGINDKKYYEILSGLTGKEKIVFDDTSNLEK